MAVGGLLEATISIVTIVGAIVTMVVQTRGLVVRPRAKLKDDLEILDSLKKQKQGDLAKTLEHAIRVSIDGLYGTTPNAKRDYLLVAVFTAIALGSAGWTYYLLRDGFTWWSVASGYLTLVGVVSAINAWTGREFTQALNRTIPASEDS